MQQAEKEITAQIFGKLFEEQGLQSCESVVCKSKNFSQNILKDCKYIDVYFAGISEEYFKKVGFVEREVSDADIIPNHFELCRRKNIEIWVNNSVHNYTYFKSDGGQDRPNYWREKE